ncbi:MAG: type II secretion system inner membrane protein GspF [Gammaproteobacteria bacterium]
MTEFSYSALDAKGRTRRGQISAGDELHARKLLRDQQLNPLSLKPKQTSGTRSRIAAGRTRDRLGSAALALVIRQLATMLEGGQPLADALGAIARQSPAATRRIIGGIRDQVVEGHDLAQALSQYPDEFPPLYIAAVAAGEKTGQLGRVLNELADHAEHSRELKQSLLLALTYPVLLAVVAAAIVIALLTYVMPQVVEVFDTMDVQLPLLTRLLLGLSELLRQFGWLALLMALFGITLLVVAWRTPNGKRQLDALILRTPLLGTLVNSMEVSRFTRTMSLVCGSAVPVPDALQLAASAINSRPIYDAIISAQREVTEGLSLSMALESNGYFPPLVLQLIHSGESSGNLAGLLAHAADLLETEFQGRIKMLVGLLEPALILAMGAIVLAIVLAILVPILDLNTLVQ